MLRVILKISLVAGVAFWVLSGDRSVELMTFAAAVGLFIGYDYGFPVRQKSLLDRPESESDVGLPEKILNGILVLIMLALGAYILKTQ